MVYIIIGFRGVFKVKRLT